MFKRLRSGLTLTQKESGTAYLFLLPILVLYVMFIVLPIIITFYLSFTEYSVLTPPKWVGLHNYKYLFFEDDIFKLSIINTLLFVVESIFPAILLALLFAMLLNRPLWLRGFFRSCIYLPYITPIVAVALVWVFLYDPSKEGFVNYLMSWFGIRPISWLQSIRWALPSMVLMSIWKTVGYYMILFLAGLQGIPDRYYEAANIDGASRLQQFWYITLPLLKPATIFVLIVATIYAFQVFQEPYILTQGGPGNSTTTIVYWFYLVSFRSLDFGRGAAISFILGITIFIFSIGYLKGLKGIE